MNAGYGRDLDLNLLRVFAVVVDTGSVTAAASRLYLAQPAVSAAHPELTHRPSSSVLVLRARARARFTGVSAHAHEGPARGRQTERRLHQTQAKTAQGARHSG